MGRGGCDRNGEYAHDAIVPDDQFKLGLRQIVSSVAIVTSGIGAIRNGLTATAVCSVSAEPPTMLACINRNASAEAIIAESGNFAINFLAEDQHNIARLFSQSKLNADERFGEGNWLSMVTGSPILDGAVASFDCEVEGRIPAASHHIYIGRVVAMATKGQNVLLYRDGLFLKPADPD